MWMSMTTHRDHDESARIIAIRMMYAQAARATKRLEKYFSFSLLAIRRTPV